MSGARRDDPRSDLSTAISLAWGCIKCAQYEQADSLLKGCLRIWPNDKRLLLLQAYVCVEQGGVVEPALLASLGSADDPSIRQLLLRSGKTLNTAVAPH